MTVAVVDGHEPDWEALIKECFDHAESERVLERFFTAIHPFLKGVLTARRAADPSLIEDAMQNAFLKFLKIFRETSYRHLTVGYFLIIGKNCLVDELRRRKGHLPIDALAEAELPMVLPAMPDVQSERVLMIHQAITQLDSRCQFVLESHYIDEIDGRTLAIWLKVEPASIHMIIKRCRDRLKQVIASLPSLAPLPPGRGHT